MKRPLTSQVTGGVPARSIGTLCGPPDFGITLTLLLAQSQSIDSNTESEIFPVAQRRGFDPLQATGPSFGLADVERWLHGYWNVVVDTLEELSSRRGAEERVSLKLLVEQLCELWERETGCSVTAHDRVKDQSTGRAETPAGQFERRPWRHCSRINRGLRSALSLPNRLARALFTSTIKPVRKPERGMSL